MTNADLVKEAYSHFATGNVPAVLALFDPAIEWHECKGMPFVKDDGIYTGPEAIVTNVFMHLPASFDGFNIAVNEIFGADDKVVMAGYYQGTNKATGNPFKANATHVWSVKKRKADSFFPGSGYRYNSQLNIFLRRLPQAKGRSLGISFEKSCQILLSAVVVVSYLVRWIHQLPVID